MAEIKRISGKPVIDYTARDYDSLLRSMHSMIPYKLPEWTDYESEADFGNVLLQLFAHMGDIISYYQDRIANESFLGTAQERRSIIHHLRLIGYRLASAAPASAYLDVSAAKSVNQSVTVKKGAAFATKSTEHLPSIRFEYTGETDIEIDFSQIEVIDGKKTYCGLPVKEGRQVKEDIIGESDGTPNRQFPLQHSPLILRSPGLGKIMENEIILVVQRAGEGETGEEWRLQSTLAFSREGDKDFIVEIDENDRAVVIFGDGVFGAVPPAGTIIKATYRVGGGTRGNVKAGAIDTILEAPGLTLLGAKVTNPVKAVGGTDRESIEHAVKQAPALYRTQGRAVTAEDYKTLALDFAGVAKARPEKGNWNSVILYIAPKGGGMINDILKKDLMVYFADKCPMTSEIEIRDVEYVRIYVSAKVGISSYYAQSPEEIERKVHAVATALLAFENVDFGQTYYISKYYEAIEAIEGVAYITVTEFRREDTDTAQHLESGQILLANNEVPVIPSETGDEAYSSGICVEIQ
ncbi:MAG: baseplate J/gp47 family protein [Candidatus Aminicenantes bacterium]|nr:baseplate J/gp47 family protein [Candidatus Aminicenantes bacterium]